ncbi:hypothetical protein EON83_09160 [bacterium]|nr:MAG: hypothetical protein EON83_09160 [bacterium]
MEHKMLWGSLAVGLAGWLSLLLLASRGNQNPSDITSPRSSNPAPFTWLGLALPVLVWLATLPTKAPFSAGQGWGRGFLLGGLIAFISASVAFRAGRETNSGRHLAVISLFGSLIVACIPLLWMRHAVIEALLGASLGWCVVSLVWLCAPHAPTERGAPPALALGLLNGSAFVAALCSVAALGVYRDFSIAELPRGTHSAIAVVLAASISLALLLGMLLSESNREQAKSPAPLITSALCLIVPLGLGFLLATRVLDDLKMLYCLAIGALLALLGWGLLWESSQSAAESSRHTTIPPVAILLTLCAFMLAYSFLQGFGVGLMLLAAWPISLLLWPSSHTEEKARLDVAQTATLLAAFLAVLLISRVFATRFRLDLRGVNLVDQFALFGFLLGAIVPTWLASLWFGAHEARSHPVSSLLQFVGIGILTLLIPSAVLSIWGIKVLPAVFAGMALALAGWNGSATSAARSSAIALFALALSLVITQWTIRFLPLAELSRSQRMHFLLWGLGGAVVLVLVVDLISRAFLWSQGRQHSSSGVSQ